MRKKFNFIMIGIIMVSIFSITACGSKAKKSYDNDKVVKSFTEESRDTSLDGILDGDVYINDVFNIKFDAKVANMEMVDDQELSAMHISHGDYSIRMEANSSDSGKTVSFKILEDSTDIKSYIDEEIDVIKDDNKGLGDENIKVESNTLNFLGEDAPCLNSVLTSGSVKYYHTEVFLQSGNHVAVIEVNTTDEQVEDCLNAFTKAD